MKIFGKFWTKHVFVSLMFIAVLLNGSLPVLAERDRPIVQGQTEGFAGEKVVIFDYTDNFVCANAPLNDKPCDLGLGIDPVTNPDVDADLLAKLNLDPSEIPDLIVIVPFFDTDGDGTLDALEDPAVTDPDDMVFVQCPEIQSSGGAFGLFSHCILHDFELDTSPLAGVTVAGIEFGGVIPLPNHSHVVGETPGGTVPWDTDVVLVLKPELWPDKDGVCTGIPCLTSFEAISDINLTQGVDIVGPVDSTLVLFFGVKNLKPED